MARRSAFTLIELTVVMAIITLLLTMVVGAHYAWKRYARLDTAVMRAESALVLARQQAITTGRPAMFVFGNGEVPLPEDSVESRAFLDIWAEPSPSAAGVGWCCVVAMTNALDEADIWDELGNEGVFPVVGRPIEFEEPVHWESEDGKTLEEGKVFAHVFLPDGGLAELPQRADMLAVADVTNILSSVVEASDSSHDSGSSPTTRDAAQTRILWVQRRTGIAGQLSREQREMYWE